MNAWDVSPPFIIFFYFTSPSSKRVLYCFDSPLLPAFNSAIRSFTTKKELLNGVEQSSGSTFSVFCWARESKKWWKSDSLDGRKLFPPPSDFKAFQASKNFPQNLNSIKLADTNFLPRKSNRPYPGRERKNFFLMFAWETKSNYESFSFFFLFAPIQFAFSSLLLFITQKRLQ